MSMGFIDISFAVAVELGSMATTAARVESHRARRALPPGRGAPARAARRLRHGAAEPG